MCVGTWTAVGYAFGRRCRPPAINLRQKILTLLNFTSCNLYSAFDRLRNVSLDQAINGHARRRGIAVQCGQRVSMTDRQAPEKASSEGQPRMAAVAAEERHVEFLYSIPGEKEGGVAVLREAWACQAGPRLERTRAPRQLHDHIDRRAITRTGNKLQTGPQRSRPT
jgi:hypothetical protein